MRTKEIYGRNLGLAWLIGLAALAVTPCPGADEVAAETTARPAAPEERKVGLEREVVFAESEEPYRMQYDPDEELPQLRYATTLQLEFRYPRHEDRLPEEVVGSLPPAIPSPEGQNPMMRVRVPSPEVGPFLHGLASTWPLQPDSNHLEGLSTLVERMPETSRLSADEVAELVSVKNGLFPITWVNFVNHSFVGGGQPARPSQIVSLTVCAEDRERAVELARAVLLAIDLGFSPQCHRDFQATAERLEEYMRHQDEQNADTREKMEKAKAELEKLSAFSDLDSAALASLIAHRRMIGVDLTGIEAKLEACEKILAAAADSAEKGSQRLQVETVKITAEIELAGLAAKRKAIDELIAKGQRRAELASTITGCSHIIRTRESRHLVAEPVLDAYHTAIEEMWAYPKVSAAAVSKIRWEPMSKGKGEGFF